MSRKYPRTQTEISTGNHSSERLTRIRAARLHYDTRASRRYSRSLEFERFRQDFRERTTAYLYLADQQFVNEVASTYIHEAIERVTTEELSDLIDGDPWRPDNHDGFPVETATLSDDEYAESFRRSIEGQPSEHYKRGVNDGWDSANYAIAYGSDEDLREEAQRRADELGYSADYVTGFCKGHERYLSNQWQDGSPMDEGVKAEDELADWEREIKEGIAELVASLPKYTVLIHDGLTDNTPLGPEAPSAANTSATLKGIHQIFKNYVRDNDTQDPYADVVLTANWDGVSYGDITGGAGVERLTIGRRGGVVRESF